jgi:hypothetical protein
VLCPQQRRFLDEHLDTNCSYPENSELEQTKGKQKPTIKPKPKSSCINNEENRSSELVRRVHYLATYRHFLLADMIYFHIHWFLLFVLISF